MERFNGISWSMKSPQVQDYGQPRTSNSVELNGI